MDTHTDQSAEPQSLDSQSATPATFPNVTDDELDERERLLEDACRRLENGEEVEIVYPDGRIVRIAPREPKTWVKWSEVAHLFPHEPDPEWERDMEMEAFDHSPRDPWEHRDDRNS